MKLELRHLAPYLPYKLKGFYDGENEGIEIMRGLVEDEIITDVDQFELTDFKPLLRPISDLSSDEFDMDTISKGAIQFLDETANLPHNSRESHIGSIQYCDMKKLLEWKFDIFGLIKEGLAIDINTIL